MAVVCSNLLKIPIAVPLACMVAWDVKPPQPSMQKPKCLPTAERELRVLPFAGLR